MFHLGLLSGKLLLNPKPIQYKLQYPFWIYRKKNCLQKNPHTYPI